MTAVPIPRALAAGPLAWRAGAVVAGAMVMALAAQSEFGLGPVTLTAQTYALFTAAGLLGGRLALGAVLLWLAAAAAGLPVLAGGASGMPALTGYAMGFLAGMAGAAWTCGDGAERVARLGQLTVLFLGGHVIVFATGWAGLSFYLDPANAFVSGIAPLIPGAVLQSFAAALTIRLVSRR